MNDSFHGAHRIRRTRADATHSSPPLTAQPLPAALACARRSCPFVRRVCRAHAGVHRRHGAGQDQGGFLSHGRRCRAGGLPYACHGTRRSHTHTQLIFIRGGVGVPPSPLPSVASAHASWSMLFSCWLVAAISQASSMCPLATSMRVRSLLAHDRSWLNHTRQVLAFVGAARVSLCWESGGSQGHSLTAEKNAFFKPEPRVQSQCETEMDDEGGRISCVNFQDLGSGW